MMLAEPFVQEFLAAYVGKCGQVEEARSDWLASPLTWTGRMLNRRDGVLTQAASRWAKSQIGADYKILHERRKIDLMVVRGVSENIWETTPVLLVEHENAHDVEVEAWNLACWRAALRVLVFYSDRDREEKVERIKNTIARLEAENSACGEYLLLSAPWNFGAGLQWNWATWNGDSFSDFRVAT